VEDRIRISAIPKFLRLDPNHGPTLYVMAFRIDRGLRDKQRYLEDWDTLEADILTAEHLNRSITTDGLNAAKDFQLSMFDGNFEKMEWS